ncbi:SAM-dependent methyltransferase [Actinomadura atramentaria]|uniref:SAM-dependent methyltransferase n=1 Tax=Actinomadura atramentaria TaxID=1990 RepID=UPI0003792EB0|nr:SAM-dependent methyltransferase [Actinomadura atramentaria]
MTSPGTWGFDVTVPNVARIYDYLLGGKDNFEADRRAAERLLAAAPETIVTVRENREFLRRAVRELARAGVRQFVDVGAGLPTASNVHEVAREVVPDARVVYVDNDPVVVTHGRALLAGRPGVTVVEGDVRDPAALLADPGLRAVVDFAEPVAVLLLAVLHFVPDESDPEGVVAALRAPLCPGSALVLSHVTNEGSRPEAVSATNSVYDNASARITLRSRERVAGLFAGLTLEEPGLVYAPEWRPERRSPLDPASSFLLVGVGRC